MLYSDYEHFVLYRQRRQDLEDTYRSLGVRRRRTPARRRQPGRAVAHGLGTALVAAGRTLLRL